MNSQRSKCGEHGTCLTTTWMLEDTREGRCPVRCLLMKRRSLTAEETQRKGLCQRASIQEVYIHKQREHKHVESRDGHHCCAVRASCCTR
mmetsp:Transcript_19154/g.36954  ORF Transcript_19154/g.36954 Transcript_19154/m.36954 type:complete len:90 (-) Transcript_19154:145-414(-)